MRLKTSILLMFFIIIMGFVGCSSEKVPIESLVPEGVETKQIWTESVSMDEKDYTIMFERVGMPYKSATDSDSWLADYRLLVKNQDEELIWEEFISNFHVKYEGVYWLLDVTNDGFIDIIQCNDYIQEYNCESEDDAEYVKLDFYIWDEKGKEYQAKPLSEGYLQAPGWNEELGAIVYVESVMDDWSWKNKKMYVLEKGEWELCAELVASPEAYGASIWEDEAIYYENLYQNGRKVKTNYYKFNEWSFSWSIYARMDLVPDEEWEEFKWYERGETTDYFSRADATMVYFAKTDYEDFSDEMITYFEKSVQEGELIERIKDIEAEYRVVSEEEKKAFDLPEEEWGIGIPLYYSEIKNDVWYCVSLTEEGDDIIVEHVGEDGCTVNYFFWNIMQSYYYSDVPLRAGGQKNSKPYFIEWDNQNYMAIPYWDKEGEEIIGVTVYKIYNNFGGSVLAIGMNSDGTIQVTQQAYDVESRNKYLSEDATIWPVVVYY